MWSTRYFSRTKSLVFFHTFKSLDDVCWLPLKHITSTSNCVHSQKPSSNIFHYIIIKKSTFSKLLYLITNWIKFWPDKAYFLRLWLWIFTSYMSVTVFFMVKWYGSQPWLRFWGSNLHGDLTKNRLKLLLLTLNT